MRKRRAVEEFKPEGILARSIGNRRYAEPDINHILKALPIFDRNEVINTSLPQWWRGDRPETESLSRREAFAQRLEVAAALYFRDDMWSKQPRPAELRIRLLEIKRRAAQLLKALGLGAKSRSSPTLIPYSIVSRLGVSAGSGLDGPQNVRIAAAEVKKLHDWVGRELWLLEGKGSADVKHAGDKAFNDFLLALGEIWEEVLGGRARVSFTGGNSKKKGQPCGRFFTYIQACVIPLKLPKAFISAGSIGSRLKRLFNKKSRRGQRTSITTDPGGAKSAPGTLT